MMNRANQNWPSDATVEIDTDEQPTYTGTMITYLISTVDRIFNKARHYQLL